MQVMVLCPEADDNDSLNGQMMEVDVATLTDTVGSLKARLADVLSLPATKQQLSRAGVGFLRNELSLAHYNVTPSTQLSLSVRRRGR